MSVESACVDPARIPEIWPLVSFMVRRAMQRGDTTFDEVERDVFGGKALLWLAIEGKTILAAVVTHLETVKGVKVCTITACGGTALDKFLPLIARLELYGRCEGCAAMRINGRTGWARLLPDYRTKCVILEKAL